jgi:hypothetical protein
VAIAPKAAASNNTGFAFAKGNIRKAAQETAVTASIQPPKPT